MGERFWRDFYIIISTIIFLPALMPKLTVVTTMEMFVSLENSRTLC